MYESFYGFSGKPFQLMPDPRFLYRSQGHTSALAYLKYGVFQGEGFIVVTGEVGAGKTTLIRQLLGEIDAQRIVVGQLVSTQLGPDDLLRSVAAAFGVPTKSPVKSQLLLDIEAFLVTLSTTGRRALLVVDEAQNLAPAAVEELRMLSNFQLGNHGLLQSFLVGQPELRDLMRQPHMRQVRQRVLGSFHLGPLSSPDETAAYIAHRMNRVGWKQDPAFEEGVFAAVHALTGAVPRRINVLMDRLLLAGFLAEKHIYKLPDVHAVAREMNEELGPAVDLPRATAPTQGSASPAAPAVSMGEDGRAIDTIDLAALRVMDPAEIVRLRQYLASASDELLDTRVSRLEHTLFALLGALNRPFATRLPRTAPPPEPAIDDPRPSCEGAAL